MGRVCSGEAWLVRRILVAISGSALRDIIAASGVEILDHGHSVSRGNFNIRCPFCGPSDPGHHMGVSLEGKGWACWRNADHRGKSPVRLIVALTGRPVWKVREMLGLFSSPSLDTFSSVRGRLGPKAEEQAPKRKGPEGLKMPKEFRHRWVEGMVSHRFIAYMLERGFGGPALARVVRDYELSYAVSGTFAERIVLPYLVRENVVTWTARSIQPDQKLRYRDLEQAESIMHKDQILFNYDGAAMGGKTLLVVEGPFDVLKGDWAGREFGVRCVGLSTNNMSDGQMLQLAELSDAFERVCISLDTPSRFAIMDSHRLLSKLKGVIETEVFDASGLGKDLGGATIRAASDLLRRLG